MKNKVQFSSALALATTFLTPVAHAQAPQADANSESWGEEIVVTAKRDGYMSHDGTAATRTDTPLIEVPQSVQVINGSLIKDQDRRTLADALVNVSGVFATRPEESALAQPIIRGFPAEIYQDGLPTYGINAVADPTSLTGVERIEVLKGPTSTVYGGGAGAPLGGLINVDAVRPTDKFGGYVAFRSGSFSTLNPYADLNVPLTGATHARITGEYQRNTSWIDLAKGNRWSIQPSISFQLDPSTELLLQGKYDRRSTLEYSGLPADSAVAGLLDAHAFPGAPIGQPRSVIVNKLATAELLHSFNESWKLTATGRYFRNQYDEYGSTYSGSPPDPGTTTVYPIFPLSSPNFTKEATVDANLLGKVKALGGEHQILVGANYDHTNNFVAINFNSSLGSIDLADPTYNLSFGPLDLPLFVAQTDRFTTIAAYLQDQATYGPLHLSGSLRYTRFIWHRLVTLPPNFVTEHDETDNRADPRIGATFDVAPGVAVFAGYATGFRGATDFTSGPGQKVLPETSRNFEGGIKIASPTAHLWGTIAVFQQQRRNVPAANPDPNNPFAAIQTGEQRARGFEADITWEPIRALSILANYAHTEAVVSEDSDFPGHTSLVGQRLARVPKDSGRVAAHYRILNGPANGLSFGAGITALSSREDFLPNATTVPGYAVVDAQASYDFGRSTVTVSAVNLAGRRGFDTYEYLSPVVIPIQPRSAYIMLKAKF